MAESCVGLEDTEIGRSNLRSRLMRYGVASHLKKRIEAGAGAKPWYFWREYDFLLWPSIIHFLIFYNSHLFLYKSLKVDAHLKFIQYMKFAYTYLYVSKGPH
jgi:hypothetical protein